MKLLSLPHTKHIHCNQLHLQSPLIGRKKCELPGVTVLPCWPCYSGRLFVQLGEFSAYVDCIPEKRSDTTVMGVDFIESVGLTAEDVDTSTSLLTVVPTFDVDPWALRPQMMNQLTENSPLLLPSLQMSPKCTFIWTPDNDAAFSCVKKALPQPPVLAHFDPEVKTLLQMDVSCLFVVGYALLQEHKPEKWRLVQCGSQFLADVEKRYATIE